MDAYIKRILVANRGEIALRVKRACDALGITAIGIASEVDSQASFAKELDEVHILKGSDAAQTYLNIEKILEIALAANCDAVHPGYGFLAENAEFASRVLEAGLVFIGPKPDAISTMGSKTGAREAVKGFKVPLLPGSQGGLSDEELVKQAKKVGFPIMLKAVAGGGGRGMRIVRSFEEMEKLIPRARAEAEKNFSNPDLYFEKYLENPRHVEVQVFGDSYGNLVHFGTRDCSIQRRHQKVVEEAPAPFLSKRLREKLHLAALEAARSVKYENAGTVEFLVEGESFYFLEMNTRIQVEHPVSEIISGYDLVALQIKVAQGEKLPIQSSIKFDSHAFEFRIYAEDVRKNFLPSIGLIEQYQEPKAPFVRVDSGYKAKDIISPHYDALISKLIVSGVDRNKAIEQSQRVLREFKIEGLQTTLPFHKWIMRRDDFKQGSFDTSYIDKQFKPAELDLVEASETLDPLHRKGPAGCEVVDHYNYQSKKFGTTYSIEVLHRSDGIFVASPYDPDGRRAQNAYCRSSNGLQTALRALIEDVLEQTPHGEIFLPIKPN